MSYILLYNFYRRLYLFYNHFLRFLSLNLVFLCCILIKCMPYVDSISKVLFKMKNEATDVSYEYGVGTYSRSA